MSTTQPEALRENHTAADMATAAAQDEALIRQLVVALEAMRSEAAARHCGLRICDEAITAARARLEDAK